jgi:hypothetical protein
VALNIPNLFRIFCVNGSRKERAEEKVSSVLKRLRIVYDAQGKPTKKPKKTHKFQREGEKLKRGALFISISTFSRYKEDIN